MAVPPYPDLVPLLARLGALFDAAAAALARACSKDGGLSATALDRQQGACFELAWARAELWGARALAAPDTWTALQQGLAAAFVAEAIPAVLARLETIHLDLGAD